MRALLHLRQQHPALRTGRLIHLFSDETGYAYVRESRPARETPQAETLLLVMKLRPAAHSDSGYFRYRGRARASSRADVECPRCDAQGLADYSQAPRVLVEHL